MPRTIILGHLFSSAVGTTIYYVSTTHHFESFIIFHVVFKLHRCNKIFQVSSWLCVLIYIRIICTQHAYNIMEAQSVFYVPFNRNI